MPKITYTFDGGSTVTAEAVAGESILDLARKFNIAIDAPCSGNGSCGKCRVLLKDGTVESERSRHITENEYKEGWRLACRSFVSGDAVIYVPDIASAYKSRMKVADLSDTRETEIYSTTLEAVKAAGIKFCTSFKTLLIDLGEPVDGSADYDRISAALGFDKLEISYYALKKLPSALRESGFKIYCLVDVKEGSAKILDVWSAETVQPVCGIAVDIGTTTVSAVLMDLNSGNILAKASSGNGQIRYGADVINRIIEASRPGGLEKLQNAILKETLLPIIDGMCRAASVSGSRVYRLAVASNTTMNHLFLGINPEYIRLEPYVPAFMSLSGIQARELGLPVYPEAELIIAPNVGSYVGGDITAGTLSSMMWNSGDFSLFIDLGTNGELVFGNSDFLMSCACSAGPAFEGGDISCGMRATDGAIDSLKIDEYTLEPSYSVIGDVKPVGLCGSGLIDTIAELYRCRIIDPLGKITTVSDRVTCDAYGMKSFVLVKAADSGSGREVALSEADIDNFIRAKGAIFSAVRLMLASLGFEPEVLRRVIIAGGIGSGINIENAVRIGMLPDIPRELYSYIGNSSLSGACCMLLSDEAREKVESLASNMTYLELSSEPKYMDEFVASCFIPHTQADLFPSSTRV
jgi:uncharacterized 2Fe-2S/4Fe-4S cluster protein (DUF4445 family)